MIIIGYQGIGKSTLCARKTNCIDLESSQFNISGNRPDGWEIIYCRIATYLSSKGLIVFTSSHATVRELLKNRGAKVIVCCPKKELRDQWLEKLRLRYESTHLDKDLRAYYNAVDCYEENIDDMTSEGFDICWIDSMDYDLETLINHFTNI